MRAATTELIRIWTEALVPVCNHSRSHAAQELKWLLQHAQEQQRRSLRDQQRGQTDQNAAHSTNDVSRSRLSRGESLSEQEVRLMESYVDQRVKTRKPLQYILGTQPFMDLEILTRPPTLIPRWETEEWTARLATVLTSTPYFSHQTLHQPIHHSLQSSSPPSTSSSSSPSSSRFRILDICTGSGCIPLGLASALPPKSSHLIGIDIHEKAIQLATENETHNRALLRGNRVNFQRGDLMAPDAVDTFLRFSSPSQRQEQEQEQYHNNSSAATTTTRIPRATGYNLIISNPPYISHSEFSTLEPEVAQWEDPNALLADQEGLIFYPRIAHMAMSLLHSNTHAHHSSDEHNNSVSERQWRNGPDLDEVKVPELVFEIGGDHQVESVSKAAREAGFRRVQVWKDLADRSRCIIAAR